MDQTFCIAQFLLMYGSMHSVRSPPYIERNCSTVSSRSVVTGIGPMEENLEMEHFGLISQEMRGEAQVGVQDAPLTMTPISLLFASNRFHGYSETRK